MIKTIDGPWTLCDDLGALFAISAVLLARYIDKQARGNRLIAEYGVPFYDDLDFHTKSLALADVTNALFDRKTPLPETAWHAAALTAVCNNIEQIVLHEIEMQGWSMRKYGKEDFHCRPMVIAAYKSCYPERAGEVAWIREDDQEGFLRLTKRLVADFLPPAYFLLADVESEKRKSLMQRMKIPQDYFKMPFEIEKMTKTAIRERCGRITLGILDRCLPFMAQGSTMTARPDAMLETVT